MCGAIVLCAARGAIVVACCFKLYIPASPIHNYKGNHISAATGRTTPILQSCLRRRHRHQSKPRWTQRFSVFPRARNSAGRRRNESQIPQISRILSPLSPKPIQLGEPYFSKEVRTAALLHTRSGPYDGISPQGGP